MKRKGILCLLLAALLGLNLAACGGETQTSDLATQTLAPTTAPSSGLPVAQAADLMEQITPRKVEGKATDEAFKSNMLRFAAELFRQVYASDKGDKTMLVSPLSVMVALTMTAGGATGDTLKEMEAVLAGKGISLDELYAYLHTYLNKLPSGEKSRFSFANSIWFKDAESFRVETPFLQKNADYLRAQIYKAPFDASTLRDINQWVDLQTDHMIPFVLEQLSPMARMVLINALAFDAQWEHPIWDEAISTGDFTNRSGVKKKVSIMHDAVGVYLFDDNTSGFMKSYAGDKYRFVALLPDKGISLDEYAASLTGEKLAGLLESACSQETQIRLPRFSCDYDRSLVAVLKAMGMPRAFDSSGSTPELANQFAGISKSEPLHISEVIHKTHIDLDNMGTRAAAVTAVILEKATAMEPPEIKSVFLDRPFVYMIVDTETMLPLFMGTVTDLEEIILNN